MSVCVCASVCVCERQRENVYPLSPPFLFKPTCPHAPIHKYLAVLQFGKVKENLPKCTLNVVFLDACFSGWCLDNPIMWLVMQTQTEAKAKQRSLNDTKRH